MGLDTVELVMAIEEEFGLEIPNEVAAKMFTVGDMHAYLVTELKRLGRADIDEARIFTRVREIVCKQLGVDEALVVPRARFVQDLGAD